MEESEYESVLCVKPEVQVYRIPPWATVGHHRGYRASEWHLNQPSWSGWLQITEIGRVAYIKLWGVVTQAPGDWYPGTTVKSVLDSSRYFVIQIED